MAEFEVASTAWRRAEWFVMDLLDRGVTGFGPWKGAVAVAEEHLAATGDPEEAIRKLIRSHVVLAGSAGFVTGLGGLATMAVAVPVGVTGVYVVAVRMAAGIAQLRGYDVEAADVRTAILVCLLGSGGADILERSGVPGRATTTWTLAELPGRVLTEINKRIGYRLLTRFGEKGALNLGKLLPVVGGPIGATMDAAACRDIATYAKAAFPQSRPGILGGPGSVAEAEPGEHEDAE